MYLSGLIRVVSIVLSAIVAVSFGMFVWDELGSASKRQALLAAGAGPQVTSTRDAHGRLAAAENGKPRLNLDKANDALTSPGESIGKKFGDNHPWAMRGAAFLFGILAFLLGLRLLASWIETNRPQPGSAAQQNQQGGFTASSR
ncbi:MAG: hypothetical protein JHD02_03555 [Thermoleophilaceae bacterium]|nr:hypothetical protein [Thermoleophilaceae bacterium]